MDSKTEDGDTESDTGVMYLQHGIIPDMNKKVYLQINFHGCGAFGYYLSHCPETEGQQNPNVKDEEQSEEKVEEETVEGDQHMQIQEMMDNACSLSSDGLYLVDFRGC